MPPKAARHDHESAGEPDALQTRRAEWRSFRNREVPRLRESAGVHPRSSDSAHWSVRITPRLPSWVAAGVGQGASDPTRVGVGVSGPPAGGAGC